MSTEENRRAMHRIPEELYNQGRLEVADEVVAADYVEHLPLPPTLPGGIAGLKAFVTMVREAFPDFHYTIEDEIAEGDRYVARVTARGTMKGAFLGMAPTGKQAAWSELHIGRVMDGKLVEHWACIDQLGMLQQLGVMPAAAQAPA